MTIKFRQLVIKDDQRTLANLLGTDKDMMRHDQRAGKNNKDAMLPDCINGSYQSEDTPNCIMITAHMFLFKLRTSI